MLHPVAQPTPSEETHSRSATDAVDADADADAQVRLFGARAPTKTTFVRAAMKPSWRNVLILSSLTVEDGKIKPSRSFITGNLAIPSLYRMLRMSRTASSA